MAAESIVTIQAHEKVVWAVLLKKNLDEESVGPMQQAVVAASREKAKVPVVLDLTQVEYVPSIALGALVNLMRSLRQEGTRLILVGMNPVVRSTLTVTRLDKLFEIHSTVDEAVKHVP